MTVLRVGCPLARAYSRSRPILLAATVVDGAGSRKHRGVSARQLVVAAALVREGRVLAARRRRPAGCWEFPGGKCEPGEDPVAALHRELDEELGLSVEVGSEIPPPTGLTWPINDRLQLRVWFARPLGVPSPGPDHDRLRWLEPADLSGVAWLPADVPVAARIAELLEES